MTAKKIKNKQQKKHNKQQEGQKKRAKRKKRVEVMSQNKKPDQGRHRVFLSQGLPQ